MKSVEKRRCVTLISHFTYVSVQNQNKEYEKPVFIEKANNKRSKDSIIPKIQPNLGKTACTEKKSTPTFINRQNFIFWKIQIL